MGSICQAGTCVKTGVLGDNCGPSQPCIFSLRCNAGKCEKGGGVGATCANFIGCDFYAGFWCSGTTCVKMTFAKVGQACNPFAGIFCEDDLECDFTSGGSDVCVVQPQKGQACAESGPECENPYHCVNGMCGFGEATTCN